jgi:hypothetical protein
VPSTEVAAGEAFLESGAEGRYSAATFRGVMTDSGAAHFQQPANPSSRPVQR